jgi:threonyl-tRNA synthetase
MENQQEREFTAEELAAQKEQMLQFYTESIPYLEAQLKYEEYLMKIDEARYKRNTIQMQWAMMMQAQQEQESEGSDFDIDNEPNIPEQGKRKLRKG